MIRIKQTVEPPSRLNLNDSSSPGAKELHKAIDHFNRTNAKLPGSEFKAYNHKDVRNALRKMQHNKCAYCECSTARFDGDIEHYRPKGNVSESNDPSTGYWWLAMDWNNLLFSCQFCNQVRSQVLAEDGMSLEEIQDRIETGSRATMGKLDHFPTADSYWATSPNEEVNEKPLLIDPKKTNPDEHLDWALDDFIARVVAKEGSEIGQTSIDIYVLNEAELVKKRTVHLKTLMVFGDLIKSKLKEALESPDQAVADSLRKNARQLSQALLEAHCTADKDFAGMSRAYVLNLQTEIRALAD